MIPEEALVRGSVSAMNVECAPEEFQWVSAVEIEVPKVKVVAIETPDQDKKLALAA